jgi:hypothetical protein
MFLQFSFPQLLSIDTSNLMKFEMNLVLCTYSTFVLFNSVPNTIQYYFKPEKFHLGGVMNIN